MAFPAGLAATMARANSDQVMACNQIRRKAASTSGFGCQLAALGLSKTFQHGGKVRGVDFLGIAPLAAQAQHGERYLILAVRRQSPHGFESLFE